MISYVIKVGNRVVKIGSDVPYYVCTEVDVSKA